MSNSMPAAADPLATLRDIHLPEAIGWWPPAPGWWFLLAFIIIIIAAIYAWLRWRQAQQNKPLTFSKADTIDAALLELHAIEQQFAARQSNESNEANPTDHRQTVAAISQLLRRCAVQFNKHEANHVAGLTGTAWLAWLDQRWQRNDFSQAAGRILLDAPYRKNSVESAVVKELCIISRTWLEQQR